MVLLTGFVVAGVFALAGATPAGAQTSQALACYTGKMGASLYHAKNIGSCQAGFAKSGLTSKFDACVVTAAADASARIALTNATVATSGFVCPGDLQSLALDGPSAWQQALVDSAIFQSNHLPNACVQKRALALSTYAGKYVTCVRRGYSRTPEAIFACAATPRAAFALAWTAAGLLAPCTTDDFATVAARAEAAIRAQGALLHVTCGDGLVAGFEQCDDGNSVSGDGCQADCKFALRCGNGFLQDANHEQCDDGNSVDGDGCDHDCILEKCGNAVVQSGESCDDGTESTTCNADCTRAACGDGIVNGTAGERCDAAGESATCNANCTLASCGDGIVNATTGEQCDSAGQSSACDIDCTPAMCGDGTPNAAAGEQCDTAGQSSSCDTDCTLAVCGDHTVNLIAGEQCDDGGESAVCNSDCTSSVCGDGTANVTAAEQCDDGNTDVGDGCDAICLIEPCGDGRRQPPEECDDGNTIGADGCSSSCKRETCGKVNGVAKCLYCPAGSSPNTAYTACTCKAGYTLVGSSCQDVDECAGNPCGGNRCDNLPGTYSCPIACTETAFHAALQKCGGASRAITFNCSDATIFISDASNGPRESSCSGLLIDGMDRNITFEMAPKCWGRTIPAAECRVPLDPDGTCSCPEVNSGTLFLALRGNNMTVRNLTVRYFFDGIKTVGNDNTVENIDFERVCDEATGNVSGVGNLYTGIWAKTACGKCMQNYGVLSATAADPKLRDHYNAIVRDSLFTDCQQPIRMTNAGRYLIEYTRMEGFYASGIFRCLGPRFSTGPADTQIVRMMGSELDGCDNGVRIEGNVQAQLWGNTIVNNQFRGVLLKTNARVSMWDNVIRHNGGRNTSELGFGGVGVNDAALLDLGGGSLTIDGQVVSSPGGNVLCDNVSPTGRSRNVDNRTAATVAAKNNYWCTANPQGRVTGSVDTDPFLTQQP